MKIIKRLLIIAAVIITIIIIAVIIFIALANHRNKNYYKYAEPKGEIEKIYTPLGEYDVDFIEKDAPDTISQKYEIWYPSNMNDDEKYPVVIMANGTGIKASKYKEVFNHLASWGFIVAGNEDENSRTGASSAETLDYVLGLNNDSNSVLYGKIDTENIGIAGHSQGGVGAINAVTQQENRAMYKSVFTASTTSSALASALGEDWKYDTSKLNIPCFFVAGTGNFDAGTATDKNATEGQGICPLWSLNENYDTIPDNVQKVIARQKNKDHGDMLRSADGYMTAWFMYHLKGETDAGKAFFGEQAEILNNPDWQNVRTSN